MRWPGKPDLNYRLPDGNYVVLRGPFGTRRDRLIVGVGWEKRNAVALVAFDRRTAAPLWTLALGGHIFTDFRTDGRALSRLLPIGIYGSSTSPHSMINSIVVVDLDTGKIVRRYAVGTSLDTAAALAGRPWVWLGGDTLVSLDPKTGAVARAARYPGVAIVNDELRVQDLRFGQLWLAAEDYARPTKLPFAVVDLATDTVTHTGGDMRPRDVTAKVRAAWR